MGVNNMSPMSGRMFKENDQIINRADMLEAIYKALIVDKNAGVAITESLPSGIKVIGATMSHGDIPNFLFDTPNGIGAPLLANAAYTQAAIDRPHPVSGEAPQGWFRGWVFTDQAGTLYLEESNAASSGWTTTSTKVVAAGVSAIIPWAELTKKYARYRFVNGATAQGTFILIQYYKGVDKTPIMSNDGDMVSIGSKNDTAVINGGSTSMIAGIKGVESILQGAGTGSLPVTDTGNLTKLSTEADPAGQEGWRLLIIDKTVSPATSIVKIYHNGIWEAF